MDADTFLSTIKADDIKKALSSKILNQLKPATSAHFISTAKVNSGQLAHFDFGQVANELSFNDFVTFLDGFGIDLQKFAQYNNWDCQGQFHGGYHCQPHQGIYCDEGICRQT